MHCIDNKEQVKIYIVIILAIVLAISAYFRFIHAKIRDQGDGTSPEVALGKTLIPPVTSVEKPMIHISEQSERREIPEAAIKDIFVPLVSPQEETDEIPEPETSKGPPALKLRGTILGGNSAIAIINDQFLRSGDWIGEYRIARIGKREVLLDSGDHKIRLEIFNNE